MRATTTPAGQPELEEFLAAFPAYASTGRLDELRAAEFARLDAEGHVYLDYTGGGLYAESQVRRHAELLLSGVFGNPHSASPTSSRAEELVHTCRYHVLDFFNASPDEYTVVFTGNASHALKLVGEAYPFSALSTFLLLFDNHNSVNGIREFARARGAATVYVPVTLPELTVDDGAIGEALRPHDPAANNLFAFPAQSNFSGVHHPLEWIDRAHAAGWDVLLDAAAFVPTNALDLSRWHPDFVALSFYKMFGYPTGVGALIARREALAKLHRPWFAGGTITVASVQADRHYLAPGAAGFEEGTVNYLTIPAIEDGLRLLERVGLEVVHERVACLTGWLLGALGGLEHANGQPLVTIYGPSTIAGRGGTIALNLFGRDGQPIDHRAVERKAAREHISLRTGSFCNPGAGETALGLSKEELEACFRRSPQRMRFDDFRRCIDGKSSGAVRLSLGLASNLADARAAVEFARGFLEWGRGGED
jgi:selenocysteine lyase/cysteine desulfurase